MPCCALALPNQLHDDMSLSSGRPVLKDTILEIVNIDWAVTTKYPDYILI